METVKPTITDPLEAPGSACTPENATILSELKDSKCEGSVAKQTVIRLKRRIDDSPSKLLVVSYKRIKTECVATTADDEASSSSHSKECKESGKNDKDDQLCSRVLRLVGTLEGDEADETTLKNVLESSKSARNCQEVPRHDFRRSVKNSNVDVTSKVRQRFKRSLEDGRFRLVNSKRGISANDDKENCGWQGERDLLNLLDLVPDNEAEDPKKVRDPPQGFEPGNVTCNGYPMKKETIHVEGSSRNPEKGFVYDLYVANDVGMEDFYSSPSQILSVEEADDDLDFGDYRNAEEEYRMDDDEDSNDEDNWRNDYPDSEEEGLDYDNFYGASGNSCYRYDNDETNFSGDEEFGNFKGLNMRDESSSDEDLDYGGATDGNGFSKRYAHFLRRAQNQYADEVVSVPSSEDDEDN